MNRLVLFDVDGTILSSRGAAPRAFRRALRETFATDGPEDGYSFAGRTDPQIARDLLRLAGIEDGQIDHGLDSFWDRYASLLAAEFRAVDATLYPGVRQLLDRVDSVPNEAVLGLLTGNVRAGAELKLTSAGIEFDRFRVGAFGSDHHDRCELPAIAVARAKATFGRTFEGKSVVIVGDTPFDISCGEHLGVRTIAVATGTYPLDQLANCNPDHLFPDLSDTDTVCEAIFR
ncbi:MAG: HAD hydrolase-like protein [Gemmatimonas sp.]|nr:HAD hydrolase-like protein [Gemmatimonas sp.]